MTISEFIQLLQDLQQDHGDVELGQVTLFDGEDLWLDYYDEEDEVQTVHR